MLLNVFMSLLMAYVVSGFLPSRRKLMSLRVSNSKNYALLFKEPLHLTSFPCVTEVKVSACNAGDMGSIPGSGRSPGEGNGNPLQYSCLENPMDGGAWWATLVHGVAKSWTGLSDFNHSLTYLPSQFSPGSERITSFDILLGWPKSLFRFSKNPNELIGQPSISCSPRRHCVRSGLP